MSQNGKDRIQDIHEDGGKWIVQNILMTMNMEIVQIVQIRYAYNWVS